MAITWQAEDTTEPIADTTIEGIANFENYSTVSGCAATYNGATMVVAIAAGSVLHNGSVVTVAGNNVTLVSDATNPRWTWIGISSVGVATIISGTPAATPTVPELGDYVCSQLVLVQANLTIATNATAKLDKRVIYKPTKTVLTTTGDTLYASGANTEARLGIGSTSQVLTVTGGLPVWATPATTGSTVPSTTTGQTLYASATNVLSALAVGTARQTLAMNSGGTLPTWQASPASVLTTTGDVLYASSANTLARLGVGSTGQVVTVAGGVPTWATPSASEWVKVAAAAIGSVTSLSITGLTTYKRYRMRMIHKCLTNPGTWGYYLCTINGATTRFNWNYGSLQLGTWTTGASTPTSPTSSFPIGGQLSGSPGQVGGGAYFDIALDQDAVGGNARTNINSYFEYIPSFDTGVPVGPKNVWLSGFENTVVASISAIAFSWTGAITDGWYILEGSAS